MTKMNAVQYYEATIPKLKMSRVIIAMVTVFEDGIGYPRSGTQPYYK